MKMMFGLRGSAAAANAAKSRRKSEDSFMGVVGVKGNGGLGRGQMAESMTEDRMPRVSSMEYRVSGECLS
jgi:hypothetical protein